MGIQETKITEANNQLFHSLWGGTNCGWAFKAAEGRSGGIINLWNKDKFNFNFQFSGSGFLGVNLLDENNESLFLVNIYSPCVILEKRKLWEALCNLKNIYNGDKWCFFGDFNSIRKVGERRGIRGVRGDLSEMLEFNEFIDKMELQEVNSFGRKFTWMSSNCLSMSRLDRFLVSEDWSQYFNGPSEWVIPRDYSDHCTVILKCGKVQDWGPKPFRFNNYWLRDPSFIPLVEKCWSESLVVGWAAFRVQVKLKAVKAAVREWNKNVYGNLETKIKYLKSEIGELESKAEENSLTEEEIVQRRCKMAELWSLATNRDSLLRQQSRIQWLKEGDANSSFFHATIRQRRCFNEVKALYIGDQWIEDVQPMRSAVKCFFSDWVDQKMLNRPKLNGVRFKSISRESAANLIAPFTMEELEQTLSECNGNKAPGPDGFNYNFFKSCWGVLKDEVWYMVSEFFLTGKLPKGMLSYFIALIPKVSSPQTISQFRPISLLGSMYKLLAKMLANRLKEVLHEVISVSQSAFIPGRQILDSVVTLNEAIDDAKRRKKSCFIMKLDFEKAYDSVSWEFLEYMMRRVNFDEKWILWMKSCVFSGNMSILVNGCPTEEIQIKMSLKQGDPLAPFLFLLVAEGLTGMFNEAKMKNLYAPYSVGRDAVPISLLQYADDTIIMGEASMENFMIIKSILWGFELASGLKINFHKSSIFRVNVPHHQMEEASILLHCKVRELPFLYLGLPIAANARSVDCWAKVIQLFQKRLSSWKCKHLSLGARITLINSVLSSLPVYYLSFFSLSKKVNDILIKLQRNFLWGGCEDRRKICWVKWDSVCQSRENGGLGIKNLIVFNKALLSK
ncbi:hypothetical protein RIF29_29084 [Crotalaria pallida]|uniref:Reverse transcriptase domain-containing protein n=1 Tax=Crotalaria pallida TaxID=3830 RepID=A0AAN9HVL2_CROPI